MNEHYETASIVESVPASQMYYSWIVQNGTGNTNKIKFTYGTVEFVSPNCFGIINAAPAAPEISVSSPVLGSLFVGGSDVSLEYSVVGNCVNCDTQIWLIKSNGVSTRLNVGSNSKVVTIPSSTVAGMYACVLLCS